jgi:hypothetical protein
MGESIFLEKSLQVIIARESNGKMVDGSNPLPPCQQSYVPIY